MTAQQPPRANNVGIRAIHKMIEDLPPSYFALVMATGVNSVACYLLGMELISIGMFWLNILFYLILCAVFVLRFIWYKQNFLADLFDHAKGPGFFTIVAATCILGVQFILIQNNYTVALLLWFVGIIFWLLITYTIFTTFTIKENKPTLAEGINGAWLLAVVSTQALAVLSAKLSMQMDEYRLIMNFFAFSMWLWGGMQYIWMMSLIFYRYTFLNFHRMIFLHPIG